MQDKIELKLSRRILIVDDEEHIRLLLRDTLDNSYELSLQSNGESAISSVKESLEIDQPFTVAILDLNMPGLSGTETATKIRELDERIHLILMTGESRSVSEIVDDSLSRTSSWCASPLLLMKS